MLNKGVWIGMRVGSKTGFLLSAFYLLLPLPLILILLAISPIGGLLALSSAFTFGLFPGTIVGLITGVVISSLLQIAARVTTIVQAITVGILTSLGIALVLHIVFFLFTTLSGFVHPRRFEYWFLLGIPSLIYIVASGYMAKRIWEHMREPHLAEVSAMIEYLKPGPDKVMLIAGAIFIIAGLSIGYAAWPQRAIIGFSIAFVAVFCGLLLLVLFKSSDQSGRLNEMGKPESSD